MKRSHLPYRIFVTVFLLLLSMCALAPFLYLVLASFVEDMSQVFKNGLNLEITAEMLGLKNYIMLYTEQDAVFIDWFKKQRDHYHIVYSYFADYILHGRLRREHV